MLGWKIWNNHLTGCDEWIRNNSSSDDEIFDSENEGDFSLEEKTQQKLLKRIICF